MEAKTPYKMRLPFLTVIDALLQLNPEEFLSYIAHKLARRPDRRELWARLDFEYRQEAHRLELQRIEAGEGQKT